MKKVLSVAMASAMVLGMGANAFAIEYSTGSKDTAAWPKNFGFEGELFVTDKNGDLIEESTTLLNDSEAVDFEPGDVIWMPLYADNQYQYKADYSKGESEKAEVNNIKLGEDYFTEAKEGRLPSVGTREDLKADLGTIKITLSDPFATATAATTATVTLGSNTTATNPTFSSTDSKVTFKLTQTQYETVTNKKAPTGYVQETVTVAVTAANFDANNEYTFELNDVKVATYPVDAVNGIDAAAAHLNEIPTEIEVVGGSKTTTRKVDSAKAVVNGKTFTATKPAYFADLIQKVNDELDAMFAAGKSAKIKDVVVTVNLAKEAGTSDYIGKPGIVEVVDGKIVVDGKLTTDDVDNLLADHGLYTGNIDKNWSINLLEETKGVAELIEKAELYKATARDYASYDKVLNVDENKPVIMPNAVYLKVTLKKEWKTTDSANLKYYVYISNNKSNTEKTNKVWVSGTYKNTNVKTVDFTWSNPANEPALWKANDNGVAVFDFADKVFFTVKMYKGETLYLDLKTAYDNLVAGEMDVDPDSFYSFRNGGNQSFYREGELVIVTDDDTLVPYEIDEDGNFVELDAEYVTNYKIAHTNQKVNGFAFNTKQLGNYVLSTDVLGEEDEEPVDEEPVDEEPVDEEPVDEEPVDETPAETAKPNPETGAADYVGLAVSLAVVSVAAAGALALKK